MSFSISSDVFDNGGRIPTKFTCDAEDVSPELSWSGVPNGTRSLALIVDDPDAPDPAAPKMVWVHWVLYNLPAECRELQEGIAALPDGTREGLNDWKQTGYRGPCPPIGEHRYYFKLYALNCLLKDLRRPTKAKLVAAIQGHVLAEAVLIGRYSHD